MDVDKGSKTKIAAPPAPAPSVYDFLDYRLFLKDRLMHLQNANAKHSQRWVAKRAAFKSPQLLSMILSGQRSLSRDKAQDLAKALKLDDQETAYFLVTVELAAADSREAQQELLAKIKVLNQNGVFSPITDDGIEIFREWYFPAVREAVVLDGARHDSEWIAGRLGISREAADEAIDTLLDKGYLQQVGDRLERSEPSIRTDRKKIYPLTLAAYHMKILERAFPALSLPRDKRHFEGLTFAVPMSKVPVLKEMIQRFFREVDLLVEAETTREEVFHLHCELFPMTRDQGATE